MVDDKETTNNFTEVNLMRVSTTELLEIADQVRGTAQTRTDGTDFYTTYLKSYASAKTSYESALASVETKFDTDVSTARTNLVNTVIGIEDKANTLKGEINALRNRIETTFTKYENYVKELEAQVEAHKSDGKYDQYMTQYGPTIELAKASGRFRIQRKFRKSGGRSF